MSSEDNETITPRPRKWMRRMLIAIFSILFVWILGDFVYSCWVDYRYRQWESTVKRDKNGVIEGCDEFRLSPAVNSATENADRKIIILLHGINDTPFIYRKMAPVFADAGFEVRAIRLPGFGEHIDRYRATRIGDWRKKLESEILDAQSDNETKVFLGAHSLGAALSIYTILQDQDSENRLRLSGLILFAPAIEVSNDRSPILSTRSWHRIGSVLLNFSQVTESPFSADTVDPGEHEFPERIRFLGRSTMDECFKLIDANRKRANEIKVPTMVVVGSEDQVVDIQAAKEFCNALTCANKVCLELENSGHNLQVDYQWQELTSEVINFCVNAVK